MLLTLKIGSKVTPPGKNKGKGIIGAVNYLSSQGVNSIYDFS